MKNKYFCIHAHFDLPSRENPWLDAIEPDLGAAPYRDGYERLYHTCCGPNAASPLLDPEGRILEFINNYAHISFDFGPHYLNWLARRHPEVYERIIEADRKSCKEHGGHGGAIATAYSPMILPLHSLRDKRAAVRWGISEFKRHFGRPPEGFWLPETAVDSETLEVLIDEGIRFTLAAPEQASKIRSSDSRSDKDWIPVSRDSINTTRPYRWRSPASENRTIAVFFYRKDLSPSRIYEKLPFAVSTQTPLKVSREQVIEVGQRFANRLVDSFTANEAVELSHIAVDGDLFGFQRLNGNRALTYALDTLLREAPAAVTTYGEFLDLFPPPQEVRLEDLSSRSCPHGVLRWSGECGCHEGGALWREPLRKALDDLGRELDERAEELLTPLMRDPKEAALDFSQWASQPDAGTTQALLDKHSRIHLTPDESRRVFRLFELQRWRLKMSPFWAWEGEDVSEDGPFQALLNAARALDLLVLVDGPQEKLEKNFIENLSRCPSPTSVHSNAAQIYTKLVRPTRVVPSRAAAHFAVAAHLKLTPLPGGGTDWDAPAITAEVRLLRSATRSRDTWTDSFSVFRVKLTHRRTFETSDTLAAVFHYQDSEIECWLSALPPSEVEENEMAAALERDFLHKTPSAFRTATTQTFASEPFALDALFPNARRRAVLRLIPRGESKRQKFMSDWYDLVNRFRLNPDLAEEVGERITQAVESDIAADSLPEVGLYRDAVLRAARAFAQHPGQDSLDLLTLLLDTAGQTGLHLPLWEIQELAWKGARTLKLTKEDEEIVEWLVKVLGISEALFPHSAAVAKQAEQ